MVAESARDFTTVCTERFKFEGRTVQCDYGTIQEAVDNASEGDLIVLGPETFYENVDLLWDKPQLTIRGSAIDNTIIDGMGADPVFNIGTPYPHHTTLTDMTIQNGKSRWVGFPRFCGHPV
jgi:hypothetical protein